MSEMMERVLSPILGEKVANSETRHRPRWMPRNFNKRWFNGRVAIMDIPPYKPPYRRHIRMKGWIDAGPDGIARVCLTVIGELDLDKRTVKLKVHIQC